MLTQNPLGLQREQYLQRPGALYQGWYFFLVRPAHSWPLDGLLCRVWLGLERSASSRNGQRPESKGTLGRVRGIICHLSLRIDERVPGALG